MKKRYKICAHCGDKIYEGKVMVENNGKYYCGFWCYGLSNGCKKVPLDENVKYDGEEEEKYYRERILD